MRYKIAVIGTGYIAGKHCGVLMSDPRAQLHTICHTSASGHVAERMRREYGFSRATVSLDNVLSDPDIDIVFVCTPDQTHADIVVAALQAGKHVFCEKPLARDIEDFRRIQQALRASGKVLQVGMNCRFREQYSIPAQMVASGDLGTLRFLRGTYILNAIQAYRERHKPWQSQYPADIFPVLHGGAIHCLDLLRWIGGEVKSAFARATAFELADECRADTFSVMLEFAGGAIGELLVSVSAFRPNDFSLDLWLSRGSIVGRTVFAREGDNVSAAAREIVVEQKVIDLGLQFEDLLKAIASGADPLNSFEEAYNNLKVLKAIERSIETGCAVLVADTD